MPTIFERNFFDVFSLSSKPWKTKWLPIPTYENYECELFLELLFVIVCPCCRNVLATPVNATSVNMFKNKLDDQTGKQLEV